MTAPSDRSTVFVCPVCAGRMELVYDRPNQKVIVCVDCFTGIHIPSTAWEVALTKSLPTVLPSHPSTLSES
jgi:hypothetical protein